MLTKLQVVARGPAWRWTAWVAGAFCLLLGAAMLIGHLGVKAEDPLKSPQLKELKGKLRLNPTDESAKQQIRQLDLRLRERYFRQLSQSSSGVYLLLGGTALFILAATCASRGQKTPPVLLPKPDAAEESSRAATTARWAVAATGATLGAGLFLLGLDAGTALPRQTADLEKLLAPEPAAEPTNASPAAVPMEGDNWPCFRGLAGGVASMTNAPESWDAKTGAGILWKIASPVAGFNSPIIWGHRVFFSGGDSAKREVVCLDLESGRLLWRQPVAVPEASGSPAAEIPDSTGYAAPTMASDGQRVYAIFATGELAAFSLDGAPVWSKNLGPLKNNYGHATSLAVWQERLLVQLDQGESDDGKSKLYAFDGRTGQIAWQKSRRVGGSWASPIVIEAAGKAQIITLAVPWVTAYAASDGSELWKVEGLGGEVTPSPIFAGGLVLAASPSDRLLAIRPDGQGDVTKTHLAWSANDNVPDITSPVANEQLVFTISSSGQLTCFDAKDGKKLWDHDLDMECHASPSLAGSQLYLLGQKGVVVVVEAARQFKELFRADMGDEFHASPAFAAGKMVIRGNKQIWALGKQNPP